jgi:hypothetical protein
MRRSRNDKIMGESAYVILSSDSTKTTGHYFIVKKKWKISILLN